MKILQTLPDGRAISMLDAQDIAAYGIEECYCRIGGQCGEHASEHRLGGKLASMESRLRSVAERVLNELPLALPRKVTDPICSVCRPGSLLDPSCGIPCSVCKQVRA